MCSGLCLNLDLARAPTIASLPPQAVVGTLQCGVTGPLSPVAPDSSALVPTSLLACLPLAMYSLSASDVPGGFGVPAGHENTVGTNALTGRNAKAL